MRRLRDGKGDEGDGDGERVKLLDDGGKRVKELEEREEGGGDKGGERVKLLDDCGKRVKELDEREEGRGGEGGGEQLCCLVVDERRRERDRERDRRGFACSSSCINAKQQYRT